MRITFKSSAVMARPLHSVTMCPHVGQVKSKVTGELLSMDRSLPQRASAPLRKSLSEGLRLPGRDVATEAKADPKELGNAHFRRVIGCAIEDALNNSGLTKQEASHAMGYQNAASISKWISGEETPQFAKLWAISPAFRTALVIAMAQCCDTDVEVRTVVTLSQRKHGAA